MSRTSHHRSGLVGRRADFSNGPRSPSSRTITPCHSPKVGPTIRPSFATRFTDDPRSRREELPTSSGLVESLIKQFNRRVKGTEEFWIPTQAETILQLRASCLREDERLTKHLKNRPVSPFRRFEMTKRRKARSLLGIRTTSYTRAPAPLPDCVAGRDVLLMFEKGRVSPERRPMSGRRGRGIHPHAYLFDKSNRLVSIPPSTARPIDALI